MNSRVIKILIISLISLTIIAIGLYFILKADSPEQIFAKNKKAVVFITTYNLLGEPLLQGSGFFLAEDGVVATNYHVIKDAASIQVKTYDDRILQPEGVIHIDEDNDVALIKFKVKEETKLYKIKLGDPSKLEVGEQIYAIGNPKGLESTFSDGIVSGIREINKGVKLIQITAPISQGSSGGPVLNKDGRAIGVSTFLIKDGQNLNFAFPISLIKDAMKTKKIIYTFPNVDANWQLVEKVESGPDYVDGAFYSPKSERYYDPDSVINLTQDIKGFWYKATLMYSINKKETSVIIYRFCEIDCNKKKFRVKVGFVININEEKNTSNSIDSLVKIWDDIPTNCDLENCDLDKIRMNICPSSQ